MTVQDLIKKLSKCDPTDIVIMSRDGEGNGYFPLDSVNPSSAYTADTTWSGEVGLIPK